jgi:hypothetical protein
MLPFLQADDDDRFRAVRKFRHPSAEESQYRIFLIEHLGDDQ